MALPVRPTLRELRESVMLRSGLAVRAGSAQRIAPLVDERIRQAQDMIHEHLDFTHLWNRIEIPLVAGVELYDWPDSIEIGHLRRLICVRFDGFEQQLEAGLRTNERNTAYRNGAYGFTPSTDPNAGPPVFGGSTTPPGSLQPGGSILRDPLRWTVENGMIRLAPIPNSYWPKMIVEAFISPGPMTSDDERCVVHPEALRQLAEILVKTHFGMPGVQEAQRAFEKYIDDLRGMQGDGDGFQVGGKQSIRIMPVVRNRVARPPLGRQQAVFGTGAGWNTWTPW